MDLQGGETPPFTTVLVPRRHRQPSPIFNPVALILTIPILLLLVLFFIIPPFISHANQILKPNSVKKSWDSLNIVLVLVAVFCGAFVRRNDESDDVVGGDDDHTNQINNNQDTTTVSNFVNRPMRQSVVSTWLDFPDKNEYKRMSSGVRLRRNSSSYPDVRQASMWGTSGRRGSKLKSHDDFEVNNVHRSPSPSPSPPHKRGMQVHKEAEAEEEVIIETSSSGENSVDANSRPSTPPPRSPPISSAAPSPPPLPSAASLKRRRSLHNVPPKLKGERRRRNEGEVNDIQPPAPNEAESSEIQSQSPPPPLVGPESHSPESIRKKLQRNMTNTKDIATAIASSLYKGTQKRKRKKKVKSRDIHEKTAEQSFSEPSSLQPQATPPPPPPPPPPLPSKVLQNLFKKSVKSKRIHSVSTTAPPPPPPPLPPLLILNSLFKNGTKTPRLKDADADADASAIPSPPPLPPSSILNSIFKTGNISRRFKNASSTPPPPPPPPSEARIQRNTNFGKPPKPPTRYYEERVIIAPPSPLIPMPPPPPPFRMREAKFVPQGDFVMIQSADSSRASSPEREDFDVIKSNDGDPSLDVSSVQSDGGDPIGPSSVTCPSPDVNAKADNFIARLRDEWRLEKINSVRSSGLDQHAT